MSRVADFFDHLRREEEGQGLVEYALILTLVAVAAVGTVSTLGADVHGGLQRTSDPLKAAPH